MSPKNPCAVEELLSGDADLETRQYNHPKAHEEVWCIKCKGQGHDTDHGPFFVNFLVGEGPMPLISEEKEGPSTVFALWCEISQIGGKHAADNCHLL